MDSPDRRFVNQREYFRVQYPIDWPQRFLPRLYIGYKWFRLIDLCEKGLRFVTPAAGFAVDETITALLKFPTGPLFEIEGIILRHFGYETALLLTKGIPYEYIYKEQLRLRKLELIGAMEQTP